MNSNTTHSKVKTGLITLSILFGVITVGGLTAQAQYRSRDYDRDDQYGRRDRDYRGYGNIYQVARDRGYQDGLSIGSEDSYKRKSYDPERSHYFRNATDGYSYGNRNEYRDAFREGFIRGYQQGYRRSGGGGRNWPWYRRF